MSNIKGSTHRGMLAAAAALCALAPVTSAFASTQAGTGIVNTATLNFQVGGVTQSVPSNTVSLTTAEILNVTIVADRDSVAVTNSETVATGFVITNTGNGNENYQLAVASDRAGVAVTRVAIDTNNDGQYDPATDQLLAANAPLPMGPGQKVRVFVLVDGTQITADSRITATVTAATGSGAPGTIFAGAGDGGSDAVVGTTGAKASASTLLTPPTGQPTLEKSQSVFAPDGSSRPVRGAIVTYRLVARFPNASRGVVIDDPIPLGTDYVANSLTLDGRALSDARDTDPGTFDSTGIHVSLGDVATAGTRTIQFSVKIQ